jgi:phosphoribosylformylglycinamidine cyclo-ligase
MLPEHLSFEVDYAAFQPGPMSSLGCKEAGAIAEAEMRRTFNCGVGMIAAVAPGDADAVCAALNAAGETASVIGALKAV